MRSLSLLLLLAASASAQPASPWRVEVSAGVSGAGDDPGVRVERRAVGPLAVGVGRTEWGGGTAYAVASAPVGIVVPRLTVGASTVTGSGVGWLRPTVGVGLDARLLGPLGLSVAVAHTTGAMDQSGTAVRVGAHLQVTTDAVGVASLRTSDAYVGGSVSAEQTRGGVLGWGGSVQGADSFTFGDASPCTEEGFGCPSGRGGGWVSAGAFGSVATRDRLLNLWARAGPEVVVAWSRGDTDLAPGVAGAVGLDVFPTRAVGVGLAVSGSLNAVVPTAGYRVGVRLRLPE